MKNETVTINVCEYTDMPIGRNHLDGPKNGSDFRDNILIPALNEFRFVKVNLNDTLGTTPSFLEEVFGGIIRSGYIGAEELSERIEVIYKYESVKNNIKKYIKEASDYKNK
ncbi:MAG: STAS-like domain-containing protein [Burkholderiaceae bacterium]|nr:STAS-like domain-containing protein [Burkholderiaceae bacterium]